MIFSIEFAKRIKNYRKFINDRSNQSDEILNNMFAIDEKLNFFYCDQELKIINKLKVEYKNKNLKECVK